MECPPVRPLARPPFVSEIFVFVCACMQSQLCRHDPEESGNTGNTWVFCSGTDFTCSTLHRLRWPGCSLVTEVTGAYRKTKDDVVTTKSLVSIHRPLRRLRHEQVSKEQLEKFPFAFVTDVQISFEVQLCTEGRQNSPPEGPRTEIETLQVVRSQDHRH